MEFIVTYLNIIQIYFLYEVSNKNFNTIENIVVLYNLSILYI